MSNYTKTTDFAAKDALSPGDPAKRVLGSQIDAEFVAIQTAINSKRDSRTRYKMLATIDPDYTVSPSATTHNATIIYNNVVFDNTAGSYNSNSGIFTVPVAGVYQVQGFIYLKAGTSFTDHGTFSITTSLSRDVRLTTASPDIQGVISNVNQYAQGDQIFLAISGVRTLSSASLTTAATNARGAFFSVEQLA